MRRTTLVAVVVCLTIAFASTLTSGQVLKADYQFQGNLNSSVGSAPALTNLTGSGGANSFVTETVDGYSRTVLRFPFNSGVAINSLAGVVPDASFTMVMLFRMDDMTGRRRILDSSGGTAADQGGFMLDNRLEGESVSNTPSLNGYYFQLILVRTGTSLFVYRDGFQRLTDTDDGSPLPFGFRFFQDYVNNPVQASAGSIARLRFYDAPMTIEQIHQLDRVPENNTGAMPILVFSNRSGTPDLYRMNSDGTSQRRLTNTEHGEMLPRFSPDGTKIVYHRRENGTGNPQIWISNSDGSNPVRLTNTATNDTVASWRPDGQKIVFSRCTPPTCDLYTMNPDGSNQQPITAANTPTGDEDFARFTPDGTKLVFMCSDANATNYQICVSNADGTNRVAITNTAAPVVNSQMDISPNSQKILFIRGSSNATNDVYTMDINGANVVNLTNNTVGESNPLWSPDGTKIMFASGRAGGISDIWIMDANGSSPTRLTLNSADDRISDWYRPLTSVRRAPYDFDGDGKTDIAIFRPAAAEWWINRSSNSVVYAAQFGATTDKIVPGDYTGDGKADIAIWRPASGEWFVLRSEDFSYFSFPFGTNGDVPIAGDFDGDSKSDATIYRPSSFTWFVRRSSDGGFTIQQFGAASDVPVPSDYDGDGKTDIAIFRPSAGQWWMNRSTAGVLAVTFGNSSDKLVQGDYTGDGKSDNALWRPSTGEWFILRSDDFSFYSFPFGTSTDLPAPGDYDGDGKFDATVFRPTNATWYSQRSTAGTLIQQFGANGDKPVPNAFVP